MDLSRAVWRKSSRTGGNNGGGDKCVEVAVLDNGRIAVRDSKQPDGAVLFLARSELAAWISSGWMLLVGSTVWADSVRDAIPAPGSTPEGLTRCCTSRDLGL